MTKSVKILVTTLGLLSILSGVYLAIQGHAFSEYFAGLFIGGTLIGSVYFYKEKS
jgi:hypothetical protein